MRSVRLSVAAAVAFAFASSASGQTGTKPKPLATPPGPEVISRAADQVELPRTVPVVEKADTQPQTSESELIKQLNDRIKKLESAQTADKDEKQKRLLLNLDILTRSEQRTESLRKQVFEMIEKENTLRSRLDQIEIDLRPEVIERALQLAGSMRPEELREARRRTLTAERSNLQALLAEIQNTRANLNLNLQKAEAMVEKLRTKLEKEIDESLKDDQDP